MRQFCAKVRKEKKELLFIFNISKAKNELQVIVQGDGITRNVYAPVKILERPGIKVTGLSYPKTINYNDEGKINFVLSSRDEIENLKILIDGQEVFTIEKFVNVNEFNVPFQGDFFLGKENSSASASPLLWQMILDGIEYRKWEILCA